MSKPGSLISFDSGDTSVEIIHFPAEVLDNPHSDDMIDSDDDSDHHNPYDDDTIMSDELQLQLQLDNVNVARQSQNLTANSYRNAMQNYAPPRTHQTHPPQPEQQHYMQNHRFIGRNSREEEQFFETRSTRTTTTTKRPPVASALIPTKPPPPLYLDDDDDAMYSVTKSTSGAPKRTTSPTSAETSSMSSSSHRHYHARRPEQVQIVESRKPPSPTRDLTPEVLLRENRASYASPLHSPDQQKHHQHGLQRQSHHHQHVHQNRVYDTATYQHNMSSGNSVTSAPPPTSAPSVTFSASDDSYDTAPPFLSSPRASTLLRVNDERTKQILQNAKISSRKGAAQLRSTHDVLEMATKVLKTPPPSAANHYNNTTNNNNNNNSASNKNKHKNGHNQHQHHHQNNNISRFHHNNDFNDFNNSNSDLMSFPPSSTLTRHQLLDHAALQESDAHLQCLSPTESSLGSIDDYDKAVVALPSKLAGSPLSRQRMLNMIDGINDEGKNIIHDSHDSDDDVVVPTSVPRNNNNNDNPDLMPPSPTSSDESGGTAESDGAGFSYYLDYLLGLGDLNKKAQRRSTRITSSAQAVQKMTQAIKMSKSRMGHFSPLAACGAMTDIHATTTFENGNNNNNNTAQPSATSMLFGAMTNTITRKGGTIGAVDEPPPAYAETNHSRLVDPRMPAWVSGLNAPQTLRTAFHDNKTKKTKRRVSNNNQDDDTSTTTSSTSASATATTDTTAAEATRNETAEYCYELGKSRTVIVHEILRGNWTWCTAWSPDGSRLAVATENHHLAVIDTTSSTVWRVRHDRRITNPVKNGTTHSIRSIAWGSQFIAIGGTGNAVSILSPISPYPIVHTIKNTGFVGTLDWRANSTILAIGSREDKCTLYNIATAEDRSHGIVGTVQHNIVSHELYTVTRKDWVNVVSFSPGGTAFAVGDQSGKLSVYSFEHGWYKGAKLEKITNFKFEEAILDVEWSPDGLWLYAGGEDYAMTIIATSTWKVKQKLPRDRWMQFVSSSHRGTHVAIGGGSSEVTILDAMDEWKPALHIELKGLVPLSAKWHPRDQYLAITGQDNSILAVETTNARHIKGHYLESISPIAEVEFSPHGDMLAVGNEAGLVSFYRSNESSFVTAYEIVLGDGYPKAIEWSPNGSYVLVGSGDTLTIIGHSTRSMGGNWHDTAAAITTTGSHNNKVPPQTTGLGVRKVIRDADTIKAIAIHITSRYAALAGDSISILDAANDFNYVKRWDIGTMKACAWSLDGTWLATTGESSNLVIFDTSHDSIDEWKKCFTLDCTDAGNALSWGPSVVNGLQYLAYGGDSQVVTVIEVRTIEGTWETVLEVERNGAINDLDWSDDGLLAVAVGDGTVTLIDLAYLKSGWAVNEMDYNWQRQGITCFTEIRRNRGKNSMTTIKWIPGSASEESLLAIGGSDGALEVLDLTERSRCKGFWNSTAPPPTAATTTSASSTIAAGNTAIQEEDQQQLLPE